MKELFTAFRKSTVLMIICILLIGAGLVDILWFTLSGGLLFASFVIFCLSLVIVSLNLTIKDILTNHWKYDYWKNKFKF